MTELTLNTVKSRKLSAPPKRSPDRLVELVQLVNLNRNYLVGVPITTDCTTKCIFDVVRAHLLAVYYTVKLLVSIYFLYFYR